MAAKKKVARPGHKAPAKAPEEKGGKMGGRQKEYDNANRGVLFLNDKKGVENRPDYTGKVVFVIPGDAEPGDKVERWLAGWIKQPRSGGDDFLSLVVSEPRQAD